MPHQTVGGELKIKRYQECSWWEVQRFPSWWTQQGEGAPLNLPEASSIGRQTQWKPEGSPGQTQKQLKLITSKGNKRPPSQSQRTGIKTEIKITNITINKTR